MKSYCSVIILLLVLLPLYSHSQGLKVKGNNFFIDERTSYIVFDKTRPVFKDKLVLSFEIDPEDHTGPYSKGYVLRIKNEESNTTYNILYNAQGERTVFNFNHEGKDVLIAAEFEKERLYAQPWIRFMITFDLGKDSLFLQIDDKKYCAGQLALQTNWKPSIFFGRSEHVIDIPTFALRNLTVSDGKKEYIFPLNEGGGEVVHDSQKRVAGHALNPHWLINDAYYWNFRTSFTSRSVAGSIFNPVSQEIYYVNKDSIVIHNVHTRETHSQQYKNQCPGTFQLGTCFIDQDKKRLYVYDVAPPLSGDITIAYLDLEEYSWTAISSDILPTQLHHHSNFFDEVNRRYVVFGGFGNTFYNKEFFSYDLDANKWSTLSFTGDKITPRYFSSMGYSKDKNVLYLFGGMGNESGDQSVGRVYYYDLYKIDLNKHEITKLWEIPWRQENMVPVRGMVLTDDHSFYTLCYPEHFSRSLLKLYHFSLADGSYEILGDSIPILSEKITTNANLYYDVKSNHLYSIVQEFEQDDIASSAKLYSIFFPPVTKEALTIYSGAKDLWLPAVAIGIILLILLTFGYMMFVRNRKKKIEISAAPDAEMSSKKISVTSILPDKKIDESKPNSIYLFGDFSLIDRHGKEINYLLSTKLKQAFFLIMQYSLGSGITSQEFSELLWPDKSEEKVKNSRGVTLNNLRKTLSDLDGIKLVHERGVFRFVFTNECYCDCIRCAEITSGNNVEQHIDELVFIASRGKFLKAVDMPLLDSFKETIERKVEPALTVSMEKSLSSGNYPVTVQLSECIFNIDPLSEDALYCMVNALIQLKMTDEARRRHFLFIAEYKKAMGEDYPKDFSELTTS